MKANELRLGNYVNVPNTEQCPFRIDAFEYCSKKFIKVAQEVKLNGFEVHPLTWYGEFLQPIPLTEEWLLKFGFEKTSSNFYKKNSIDIQSENDYFLGLVGMKHQYVHQLQNFYFAFYGEELTLKSEQ